MKVKCSQNSLNSGIQIAQKAISSSTTLPILSGILLQAEKNRLTLSATDLEISICCGVKADIGVEGSVVIPARLLGDVVRNLPEAAVKIESNPADGQVDLSCEKSHFTLRVLPPEDFPKLPHIASKESCALEAKVLGEIIKQVVKATSRDETRPVLAGALLTISKNRLKLVATDSYRLAVREVVIESGVEEKMKAIIPARALEEVSKIATSGKIEVGLTENQAIFNFGETVLVSRLIEGQFPNYQQLLPERESYELQLRLSREQFMAAVKRVSVLAQSNSPVRLKVGEGKVLVSAASQEVGRAEEEVVAKSRGGEMEIAFNAQYLLDGLGCLGEDEMFLEAISPLKPGLLRPVKAQEFLYLIMPVRIS